MDVWLFVVWEIKTLWNFYLKKMQILLLLELRFFYFNDIVHDRVHVHLQRKTILTPLIKRREERKENRRE